ncbi:metallophosphoesterase [Hyalangium sp.]|uniref:metallophosphoesterase n=1 Tax=Hyalangium sp. TaxID=2028555 RepID=UPI002D677D2C|nr:metallophosphoesterase [Hyalangium sp.]HYH96116.1 metallophosphoesterase [Hyalangium sp.]
MSVRILHFSDIHISAGNAASVKDRIEAMLAICAELMPIDAIFFTGDATLSGQPEQFVLFHRRVVEPLLETFTLQSNRFYIVPGNHDVDRTKIRKIFEPGLREAVATADSADELWRREADRTLAMDRLGSFVDFAQESQLQGTSNLLQVRGEAIGIACLNSVWTSSGDEDRNKLVITRAQLDEQHDIISDASVKVALWHHPLDWLLDEDRVRVRDRMLARFDMCCMGHLHEDDGLRSSSPHGECYFLQAPALLASKAQTGFLIYEVFPSARSLTAKSYRWDSRRGMYHLSPEFAPPHGVWQGPLPNRTGLDEKALTLRSRASHDLRSEYHARLLRHLPPAASLESRDIDDRFIEPHLIVSTGKRERPLRIQDIIKDSKSYLINGEPHSGKTTLLDYVGAKLNTSGCVALRVDFSEIVGKAERQGLVNLLSERLKKSKSQVEKLLKGPAALLIDNIVAQPSRPEWNVIENWRKSYPSLRAIAVGPHAVLPPEEDFPGTWVRSRVEPLPLQRVRQVLSRFGQSSEGTVGQKLEASLNTLLEAELPRWPWVILILAELTNRSLAVDVTNLVSLLRTYTDLRLGAFEIASGERPRIRARMLRVISAELMKRHKHSLTVIEATELIGAEIQACGIDTDPKELLEEMIASQLLIHEAGEISFVFFVLQEYFYATYLHETMWSSIHEINGDSLIRRGGALVFLAEMVQLPQLVEWCLNIVKEHMPEGARPFRIEELADLTHLLPANSPENVVSQARAGKLSDDQMGEIISKAESSRVGMRFQRVRHGKEGLEALGQSIYQFISAVSVLRSSMWLHREAKLSATRMAVDLAATLVGEMLRDEELTSAIMDDVAPRWKGSKNALSGFIGAVILLIVGHLVAQSGGAKHLSPTLREAFLAETDELRRILMLMWYSELGGPDMDVLIARLLEETSSNTVIGMLEFWLTTRFITSVSFGSTSSDALERVLRLVVQEKLHRFAKLPAIEVKRRAEAQMQEARKLKLQHTAINE